MMVRADVKENAAKDIGDRKVGTGEVTTDITSEEQQLMKEMRDVIGNSQVTRKKLEFSPEWVIQKVLQAENDNNWKKENKETPEGQVESNSNEKISHVIYKIKVNEDGTLKLKARICPRGNRDELKDEVRKDSATAQFNVIRLILEIATYLQMRIGILDISGPYMQIGPIKREIFVRPPREWDNGTHGSIWEFLKLP